MTKARPLQPPLPPPPPPLAPELVRQIINSIPTDEGVRLRALLTCCRMKMFAEVAHDELYRAVRLKIIRGNRSDTKKHGRFARTLLKGRENADFSYLGLRSPDPSSTLLACPGLARRVKVMSFDLDDGDNFWHDLKAVHSKQKLEEAVKRLAVDIIRACAGVEKIKFQYAPSWVMSGVRSSLGAAASRIRRLGAQPLRVDQDAGAVEALLSLLDALPALKEVELGPNYGNLDLGGDGSEMEPPELDKLKRLTLSSYSADDFHFLAASAAQSLEHLTLKDVAILDDETDYHEERGDAEDEDDVWRGSLDLSEFVKLEYLRLELWCEMDIAEQHLHLTRCVLPSPSVLTIVDLATLDANNGSLPFIPTTVKLLTLTIALESEYNEDYEDALDGDYPILRPILELIERPSSLHRLRLDFASDGSLWGSFTKGYSEETRRSLDQTCTLRGILFDDGLRDKLDAPSNLGEAGGGGEGGCSLPVV